ncbi:MAG TPA: AAA family ATPase [Planctomycetaceae bacterium]|nr:AAA family ATPase [Planctomycetaceae bacterium]HQZ63462.1 AAA family ATPase [Planctomycetaceae bacterium]
MPEISIRIHVITQIFEDDNSSRLGEALFFPDVSCLNDGPDGVRNLVAENVLAILAQTSNAELSQRMIDQDPERFDVQLIVEPAERNRSWQEPIILQLPAIQWQQAPDAAVVFIPSLGIEVIANKVDDLPRLVENEVRLTLFRTKTTRSLKSITRQARCRDLSIDSTNLEHFVIPPKQQAQDERKPDPNQRKVLTKVADMISGLWMNQAFERDDAVRQLADVLAAQMPRSVLLVGRSGVGKTAILKEVVRRSSELGLSSWKFWGTSGSRLVSGMTGFGMWQERCDNLRREMVEDNVVLHIGSLMELMEVGRSECQTQGIASYLRPAIARGEILLIAECTPEQLSLIERQDVALLRAFLQLRVEESPPGSRIRILTQVARSGWTSTRQLFSPAAIEEIERLHRRFATYSAFPARPVRFLQNLRRDAMESKAVESAGSALPDATPVISPRDVTRAFSRETGLPWWLLDDKAILDLTQAEEWISTRVIGQPESVQLIVNLLATLKAQLNRDHKPLASFLFIGPTGVGKTEMAKTLAEYMFGAAGAADTRMIRIDMSEYADPFAVQRLIGGTTEAEGVLTARVREQPFAVVLLDEFEKAHESLFDLLLQILGEGRLTDAAGRIADFRNCVVIMTSNLGATTFARGSVGFGLSESDVRQSREHFEKSVRGFVRPELFNRIDRIVPFAPLDRATARKVVERQIDLIRERDGLKYRRVTLSLNDDVIDYLLEHGFEPRYGARSLKRVMEKQLLAPLAERFNRYAADTVLTADCKVNHVVAGLVHTVRAQADAAGRVLSAIGADAGQLELVNQLQGLRSKLQRLKASSVMLSMENRVVQLERSERRWNKKPHQSTEMLKVRHELNRQREWMLHFDQFMDEVVTHEDQSLMALYADEAPPLQAAREMRQFVVHGNQQLSDQLLHLLELQTEHPDEIRLLLVSDDSTALRHLAQAYFQIATDMDAIVVLWQFLSPGLKRESILEDDWTLDKLKWEECPQTPNKPQAETWRLIAKQPAPGGPAKPLLLRQRVNDSQNFLSDSLDGVFGLMFDLSGAHVHHRFALEDGQHRFHLANKKPDCHVFTNLPTVDKYLPPFGIERRGSNTLTDRCRDYDYGRQRMTDMLLAETTALQEGNLGTDLGTLLIRRHRKIAERLIE